MGAVFRPKKLSRKPRKKISNDSIKDILPETSEDSDNKLDIMIIVKSPITTHFFYKG